MTPKLHELTSAIALCLALVHSAPAQSLAEPLKTVIPVQLNVATGDITVGSTTYPGANPGMHFVALKRQPDQSRLDAPDLIASQTFTDAASANNFLQETVLASTPDAILILNAVGNYGFALNQVAKSLEQFGSATDIEGVGGAIPFVLVGNGGLNIAGAHQSGYSNRNMSGYLAQDAHENYKFIQADYIKFDIGLDGSITVGATTYTVAGSGKVSGCNGQNAFHVVAVQRDAPGILIGNESYCTAQSDNEITHIITDLSRLVGSESNLVFIASNGYPIPANRNFGTDGDARLYPLAQLIAQLGGYWETIVYLTPTDTFSLVGATAPPAGTPGARRRGRESSSVYPSGRPGGGGHATGELHGVLTRGLRGNWYSPVSVDLTGQANLGFYQILAQPPVAFPHPANQTELTAFQYIASKLCGSTTCNPRNNYANTNIDIDVYISILTNLTDQQNDDCNNPANSGIPFCIMRQQLLTEFDYVADIRDLNQNLNELWSVQGTNTILTLIKAQEDIGDSIPAPPPAPAPSLAGPLVNFFLGVAGSLPTPLAPIFGLADTAFNLGLSLDTDPSGNPTISLNSTVSSLAGDAINHFTNQGATTGTQFDFIYQDWGRISTLGTALQDAQPGSSWYWNGSSTTAQILQSVTPSIQQAFYQSLMAAAYAIGSYVPGGWGFAPGWGETPLWQQPQDYGANADNADGEFVAQPFNYQAYAAYTFPGDVSNPDETLMQPTTTLLAAGSWLGISTQNTPNQPQSPTWLYNPPTASIMNTLFTLPTSNGQGGLGVYRPAFFEGWPFPRVTCDVSTFEGDPGQGCDWGSAAPPVEALPAPLIKVSIKSGRTISRSGTQLDIPLIITNSGTVDATAIFINKITLRALGGPGDATLVSPAVPIDVGNLAPGAIAKVFLHVGVPPTVKKLVLVEDGSVETGQLLPYKFSLGQVVFPSAAK